MTRVMLGLLLTSTSVLSAQQAPIIGTWEVSYAAGLQMVNGEATPIMAAGVLTVVAKGDSLIGELATTPSDNAPARPPLRLAAPATIGANVVFTSYSEAQLNMNGEERTAKVVATWTISVTGDNLTGGMERRIEGMGPSRGGAQPITGTRIKR